MYKSFPSILIEKFDSSIQKHRLKRGIISNEVANDLINHMGMTFVTKLEKNTGVSFANIAAAYVVVRDVFHLPHWFKKLRVLIIKFLLMFSIYLWKN